MHGALYSFWMDVRSREIASLPVNSITAVPMIFESLTTVFPKRAQLCDAVIHEARVCDLREGSDALLERH